MTKEQTLSMIKPDAVQRNLIGPIISLIEASNLVIKQMKMLQLSIEQAENFYRIHKDRDFYSKLIEYMTSGCVVVLALEGDNAIKVYRDLMGSTNPLEAKEGTIRRLYGTNITHNSVHGSDSLENAIIEIDFFFK
ncbi:MAG: nucleoside-diphosphate kinase [Gammaproteobacteria bacterium]|jgi:nucleoside-diphosphate kinase|nr:nucleoside-diphosphate kinase [Gammaproteobacteria bacterium]MBT4461908.1 nucleoside-diphosphate kinase [Gammaproteobacteria bacterium]MBT4654297.1 nucleoside-diphosphate kinase [Gammaproteobacteria bacterium]MBT5116920.1 nucleoside-diphosphate kinase [Gammaproteobacteria bacterium]MBT5761202.1 nucleoside-diphosphate kinase [Gammaproteobacteria bacterium]